MLDTFPAILTNTFIQQQKGELAEMQRQYAQLSEKLGDKHPDIIKLKSAIQISQTKLNGEIAKIVQSVKSEYQAALAQENSLASALNQQKSEALAMNRKAIDDGVLERDMESSKQLYQNLLQRAKETGVSGELKTSNIRIVGAAERPGATKNSRGATQSLSVIVLTGSATLAFASIFTRLLSIPASMYLTRRLGPGPYGEMALIGTASGLASSAAIMGLDVGYARFGLGADGISVRAVERFCWVVVLGAAVVAGSVAALGYFASSLWNPALGPRGILPAVVGIQTIFSVTTTMAVTRLRIAGAYRRIALSAVLGGIAGVGLNVMLAWQWRQDVWPLVVGVLGGALVQITMLGAPSLAGGSAEWPSRKDQLRILAVGWALVLTAPAYWVMASSDRWLISYFFGTAATGVYNFGAQFGLLAYFLATAVTATWLPEVARIADAKTPNAAALIGRAWDRVTLLFMIAWLGISLFGPELIRAIAAPSFFAGTAVVAPIAAGALFNGLLQFGMTGLVLGGKTWRALTPTLVCAAAGVGANLLVIPRLGWQSAAWVNAITFAALAIWLIRRSSTLLPTHVRWGRLASVAMGLAAIVGLMGLTLAQGTLTALTVKALVFLAGSLAAAVAIEGMAGIGRLFEEIRNSVLRTECK